MSGDNCTESGGSWEVQNDIVVCADTTNGADALVNEVVSIIQSAGKNVTSGGVGPSTENYAVKGKSNTTIFWIVNGVDRWMCSEFDTECGSDGYWKGPWGDATHCNIVVGFWSGGGGACTSANIHNGSIGVHDGGWATQSLKDNAGSDSADQIMLRHSPPNGWVAGPDAQTLANSFLSGTGTGGGGVGANVVEGHIWSQEGSTPQFWSQEGYTEPVKIRFTNYELQDEYPRVRTANFESPDNIDLTEGRVAVHITGDCNDFGGIIIKKEHDNKTGLYRYQCQGFMERIMSAPVYVVANGGKTAHRLIQEYLNDIGLPDVELGEEDDYDEIIDEELYEKMQKNKDLAESTDVFNVHDALVSAIYSKIKERNDAKKEESESSDNSSNSSSGSSSNSNSTSNSSSGSSSDSGSDTSDLEALAEEDESKEKNPMKKKPVGLYDKFTGGDFIRTLIFDYGINVDFYGDVNGIPHFDIMDMEEWTTSGWYLAPNLGMEYDYNYTYDITNVVTQVGVKNISAIDGNGELYTAEELLGIPLDEFVGRMGTIVDNPSAKGGNTGTAQGQTVYVDEEGNQYDASQVLTTNGEPSCNKCSEKNGGSKPEQKKYQKYWVNKCPGCEKEGKLKSEENVTTCECGLKFCQFCGYEKNNGSVKLIEVTPQTVTTATAGVAAGTTTGTTTPSTSTSNSSSGSGNSSSGSGNRKFTNHFTAPRGGSFTGGSGTRTGR